MMIRVRLQAGALSSDLVFVVSGSSGLRDALDQRGVNATETQLLFNSDSPGMASCCPFPSLIMAVLPGAPESKGMCCAWVVAARMVSLQLILGS